MRNVGSTSIQGKSPAPLSKRPNRPVASTTASRLLYRSSHLYDLPQGVHFAAAITELGQGRGQQLTARPFHLELGAMCGAGENPTIYSIL
jgi:hypothetical protein